MMHVSRNPIPTIVQQHVEEAAILYGVRSALAKAPHVKLHHLGRWDERIAAHLDGIAVAGEFGWQLCEAALERPGNGELFAATVRALEDKNASRVAKLLAVAEALPEGENGLISAFGWVSAQQLKGTVRDLLASSNPFHRRVGLMACGVHQVDPGPALDAAIKDGDARLRASALLIAGEIGRGNLRAACLGRIDDGDADCALHAAGSALLLGDRKAALAKLELLGRSADHLQLSALCLFLKAVPVTVAHEILKAIASDPKFQRALLQCVGIVGDPYYVPWLMKQMEDLKLMRLAGESFSLITGLDLAYLDMETKPPQDVELGPNDNPDDANVAMDEDDSLPWPDVEKIRKWWDANKQNFQNGQRYFMGKPPTSEHCLDVLRSGFQRQRIAAAHYRCLVRPGTPLFNTSAPTWRQQKLLGNMA